MLGAGAGRRRLRGQAVRVPGARGPHPRRAPAGAPARRRIDRAASSGWGRWSSTGRPAGAAGRRRGELTPKEFDLLALLAEDPGAVFDPRARSSSRCGTPHWCGPTKTLDVHVASLRKKLRRPRLDRDRAGRRLPAGRRSRSMTRRLLASYLTITVFVLAGPRWCRSGSSSPTGEHDRLVAAIERDATRAGRPSSRTPWRPAPTRGLDPVAADYAGPHRRPGRRRRRRRASAWPTPTRRPAGGRDFSTRPEIAAALRRRAQPRASGPPRPSARELSVRGRAGRVRGAGPRRGAGHLPDRRRWTPGCGGSGCAWPAWPRSCSSWSPWSGCVLARGGHPAGAPPGGRRPGAWRAAT